MTSLTLLLLVDAFRPDYLRDAPRLTDLAGTSATGRLRETFGFLPRAAYFGGLSPEQFGFTNMLCRDPARSPFTRARWLPAAAFRTNGIAGKFRGYVDDEARAASSDYAASYVSSLNIPGELLPQFALCETEAPWSARAGYRSIFHDLDDRGLSWTAHAWPLTNRLRDRSDAGIVESARDALKSHHRFAFVHLQQLDGAGHQFGPESRVLRSLVRETDDLVAGFIESLRQRYDELKILIFGDHGMLPVTRAVDVRPALSSTGLVPGIDYTHFLDSTMVRLWFLTSRARRPLLEALGSVAGLQLITQEEKRHHRIAGCLEANGHEIFLAEPGVVIAPNFFGDGPEVVRGMHGYDPDCVDNQGIFIAHAPEVPLGDAGIVDATDIYDWTRELLGLATPRQNRVSSAATPPRRFTQCGPPSADACIGHQIDAVLESLSPLTAKAEAIVLTGSFGRAEGGAVAKGTCVSAINDFDLIVVGGPDISNELGKRAAALASGLGLDFLDLAWTDGAWTGVTPTMFNLDLRYGSHVLRGTGDVLARMPIIPAAEIELHDALTLLLNRIGGLLSGLNGLAHDQPRSDDHARRYLINQIVKALVAVGDAHLIEWHGYDASYRVRRQRFASLAPGAGVTPAVCDAVDAGYRLKVTPDYDELPDPSASARRAIPIVLETLRRVGALTFARRLDDVRQIADALLDQRGPWVAVDNGRLRERPDVGKVATVTGVDGRSIRQAVYAAMVLLLSATTRDAFDPSQATEDWPPSLMPVLRVDAWSGWDAARREIVPAWLAMIH